MTSKNKFLDLETYSQDDLVAIGAYNYDAEIVCASVLDEQGKTIFLGKGKDFLENFKDIKGEGKFICHNAVFEYCVLKKYIKSLKIEDFICSSFLSVLKGGPASLDNALHFWKIDEKKFSRGRQLIKNYHKSIPLTSLDEYYKSPEYKELLYYCLKDTQVMRLLYNQMNKLRPDTKWDALEHKFFYDTNRLNEKGIPFSEDETKKLLDEYEAHNDKMIKSINKQFGINPRSTTQIKKFLKDEGENMSIFKEYKRNRDKNIWEERFSTARWLINANYDNIGKRTKEFFGEKEKLAPSTVKRCDKILKLMREGKVHGVLRHFGAITGRYTSNMVNILNFPKSNETIQGRLRTLIRKKDKKIIISDLAQIEFRVLMYFCGRYDVLDKLVSGDDIYVNMAKLIFKDVGEKERYLCKATTLSCGFGASASRVRKILSKDIKNLPIETATKLYNAYQYLYPEVKEFEQGINVFLNSNISKHLPKNVKTFKEGFILPSGRKLYVRNIGEEQNKYAYINGKDSHEVKANSAVNWIVQGTARDIIFYKQREALEQGIDIIYNEYDKLVAIGTEGKKLDEIMNKPVDFLPKSVIDSETEVGECYV